MLRLAAFLLFIAGAASASLAQDAKPEGTGGSATPSAQPMTSAPVREGSAKEHAVPVPEAPKKKTMGGGAVGGGGN